MDRVIDNPEVARCAYLLSKAESSSDADLAWLRTGTKSGLTAILALDQYKSSVIPRAITKHLKGDTADLLHYFSGENVYFLNDKLLCDYLSKGRAEVKVDYSIMFDTNFASYINCIVRGGSLKDLHNKVIQFLDDMLHDDLNFDFLFYMVENVKQVQMHVTKEDFFTVSKTSKVEFWRSLNKKFRNNLVSLQIFRSIDCIEYKRSSNPKPLFSYREAARRAVNYSYKFYASEEGRAHVLDFTLKQRVVLLQVIGMIKINFSSKKSAKNKISAFFDYVNEVVGIYLDREAIIAHKYFTNPRDLSMLEKIKPIKAQKRLLKKLDNIAWDLASPRFMEKLVASGNSENFFLPLFLTYDDGLKELHKAYPVKGIIFDAGSGDLIPLPKIITEDYFDEHLCSAAFKKIPAKTEERLARPPLDRNRLHELIKQEYKALREILL